MPDVLGQNLTVAGAAVLRGNSGVSAGSYTNANITVDANGRVTAASNGSGGSSLHWRVWAANDADFPASGAANFAQPTSRRFVLDFPSTGVTGAYFKDVMRPGYTSGNLRLRVYFFMATATTGNVRFRASVEAITPADASPLVNTATSFAATSDSGAVAVPGTLILASTTINLANLDSIAALDAYQIFLERDTTVASNASGSAYVWQVVLEEY